MLKGNQFAFQHTAHDYMISKCTINFQYKSQSWGASENNNRQGMVTFTKLKQSKIVFLNWTCYYKVEVHILSEQYVQSFQNVCYLKL